MVSRIETFCKLLARSSHPSSSTSSFSGSPSIRVSHNRISTPGGESWTEFTKVFNADSRNTSELYTSTCGALTQCFVHGYNASLLLLGTGECLQGLLTDNKGPFMFLTEHLTHVCGKQFKNKGGSSSSRVFMPQDQGSLPFVDVKDSVLMKVYVLNGGGGGSCEVQDLSRGKQSLTSISDQKPFLDCDYGGGTCVQNMRRFSLLENSPKDSCKYLGATLRNIDLVNSWSEESCLVVEYVITKKTEMSQVPQISYLRIVLLVINEAICKTIDNVCKDDFFQEKLLSHSSMDALTLYLSDVIGGNSVTKAIVFMDGSNNTATETLMKISNGLRNVQNHPVLVTPQFKSLVTRYHNTIKKLRNIDMKSRGKDKLLLAQLENRLVRSEQAYKDILKVKEKLTKELEELKAEYDELATKNENISSEKDKSTTANLQAAKELLDLKIHETSQHQAIQQHMETLRSQALKDQDRAERLERDFRLERRLHEELKKKHDKLKQSNSELNEEYLNLKVNLHNMTEKFDDQNKHIGDQEKAMSALLQGKDQVAFENNRNAKQMRRDFAKHLVHLSSILGDSKSDEALMYDETTDTDQLVNTLKEKIVRLRDCYANKETSLNEVRKEVAERLTRSEILEDENRKLKHNSMDLSRTLEQLSKDYQQRLQTYIKNIKDFIANNSPDTNNNLMAEAQKMTSSQQTALLGDVNRLKENLQQVQQEKNLLTVKFQKLMVAYRQYCERHDTTSVLLPTDDEVEMFKTRKQIELEEQLRCSQNEVQKLQAKLEVIDEMKHKSKIDPVLRDKKAIRRIFSTHALTRDVQFAVEREKAELISRCIMAEQEVETLRVLKDQEIESLQKEITFLRHYIEQSAAQLAPANFPHLPSIKYRNER